MAIGRSKGPRVLAVGEVLSVTPRAKNADGSIYAHDVTLATGDGASVFVRIWERSSDALGSISVGRLWAAWCEVTQDRDREGRPAGNSLTFDAVLTADELDRIGSAILAPAGK